MTIMIIGNSHREHYQGHEMGREPNLTSSSPNGGQHLFAQAALFAKNFSIDWIVELTQKKVSQILSALEEGIQQGWLVRKSPGVFCFANPQQRLKWQALLSPKEKEQMHWRIAELLLREPQDDDHKAQAVAPHLLCISNNDENCRWLMRAGDLYRNAFRTEEALQCYTKVLHDLSSIHGEEIDSLFMAAAIQYSKISTARHETTKVLSVLWEAMNRAKKWDKQAHQSLLKMHIAKSEWLRSRYSSALKHFQEGWVLAKKIDDPKLLRSATTFSTFFLYWQGRYREAVHYYEKSVPDVEKYPHGGFPLFAALTVGHCYAQIGQITQGLGMLDGIRIHCLERGNRHLAANAGATMGVVMLDIGRPDDALQYLERSVQEAREEHNDWIWIIGKLMLAFAYYLKGKNKRSIASLREFLVNSRQVLVTVHLYPYLMELCWAIEQGRFPRISGLSIENEVHRMIRGQNLFLKGVAYKYQALLEKQKGLPSEKIVQLLNLSLRWLEESGHQIELAKSKFELARQYLILGEEEKAKEMTQMASKVLYSINEALIPDDLKSLVKDPPRGENLLKEILKVGKEVVTIRDNKDLVQHILSTVNRITGAERGAIFLMEGGTNSKRFQLRASKNITSEQIIHPSFRSSMKMIEDVALTGKGRIHGLGSPDDLGSLSEKIIRSCICVPMILRDKVVGVLYHDNCLFSSAFRESDLELLAYFAAQAAFAMDNAGAYEEIQRLNQRLKEEKLYYEEQHLQSLHFEDIVGESAAIMRVLAQVDQVAGTDTTVLILGETGVGKELVARAIHRNSPRRNKPFIRVFCSAFPESLISSELFGHERGAFTGAIQRRIGRFELADGGTILLDEIGDLPLGVQIRLLRVVQNKEFERVGGSETLRSDFRLLVATNRDLEQEVKAFRFRSDLFYRFNVFPIYVPPLRERKEDIPLLAHYFLKNYATKMGKIFAGIPESEMDKLMRYDWPGNVRELENIIERATILSTGNHFHIPELGGGDHTELTPTPKAELTLKENERRHILWALQKTGWKVRGRGGAAELLEIHPSTLNFRMKKLGVQRPLSSSFLINAIK